ncbi:MAG: AAA family ATPase [Saprospiraceae bacterium]
MATSNKPSPDNDFYFIERGLEVAVKMARDLQMPLLVTGEPGTGKTELANWIAGPEMLKSGTAPYRFDTKTTSSAKDLFYRYDAIRHFSKKDTSPNPMEFITFEAMGKAILEAKKGQPRRVVLVDEIDKAPRDFPNDVLFQFERFAFRVEEATRKNMEDYQKDHPDFSLNLDDNDNICCAEDAPPPFLLLTSNSEKNLPDAFLRRCVFYHIQFPSDVALKKIVEKRSKASEDYLEHLDAIVDYFLKKVRDMGLQKKPATSELIKWVEALEGHKVDWGEMDNPAMLEKLRETLPVLLKNKEDLEIFKPPSR